MRRQDLEGLNREQLIAEAERRGVPRPRVLTQPELFDEIISRSAKNERERARARGWLGRARDLLARVVEKGLHLPDAARAIRQTGDDRAWPAPPPPLPTVTLAEIYAAQGHLERAVSVLDEVLAREPDHAEAKLLRARFVEQSRGRRSPGKSAIVAGDEGEDEGETTENEASAGAPSSEAASGAASAESLMADTDESAKEAGAEASSEQAAEGAPVEIAEPEQIVAAPTVSSDEAAIALSPAAPASDATTEEAAEPAVEVAAAAAAAVETAAEPELPARYDVDEIVAIAVDPRTIYLYWEVRATTLARAQARRPDGFLGVRVASVSASWDGPVVSIRDLRVDSLYGDRFIRDVQPGSNVRVSVGWQAGGEFEPFAVGIEVTAPHLAPIADMAEEVARWSPISGEPVQPRRSGAWAGAAPSFASTSSTRGEVHFGHQEPARLGAEHSQGEQGGPAAPPPHAGAARRAWASEQGAPIISWNEQGWVTPQREIVREGAWFQPGGASELGRGGPLFWLGGASELGRGGASELGRG